MLQPGDKAPNFEIPVDNGSSFELAHYRGRPVVIYFYPKDDTSGCTAEARDFTAAAEDFADSDVVVIGISPDSVASHQKFKAKHSFSVLLGADEGRNVIERYGVWVEKSMYGRKYMGVERATFLIDDKGRIAQIWRKVRVTGHIKKVLAAAREL
ncbi:MAG: peroxiredoxin [Alphaproteobacteria bacterium]|nr:peroxiredoxin [Alphaproteobacteria bacterium]